MSKLEAALRYAARNIPVFPCRVGGKEPLTHRGFKSATTDPETIKHWWTAVPDANIAMPTGKVGTFNTFDVLDIDFRGDKNGYDVLHELIDNGLEEHALAMIETPSGGRHIYFKGSHQRSSKISGRMVDFKAYGGYVLVPPSEVVQPDGLRPYLMRADVSDAAYETATPLNWKKVQEIYPQQPFGTLHEHEDKQYSVEYLLKWLGGQGEGNRNNALHWAVCRAIEAGQTEFYDFSYRALEIGLDPEEVEKTINSAIATYSKKR